MLAVQRALVRLCASRADTVALLGLPAHYREPELNRHLIALGTNLASGSSGIVDGSQPSPGLVTALRPGERAALDYASLYYPWLRRGEPQPYRQDLPGISPTQVTPEGAVAGLLASRAQLAGAWISAANQPLIDVLGLSPYLDEAMIASLSMRGVNMVQRGARGFLLARTDTLSANNELRPLSVRRLLTLLRRLIDREGNRYVFEPNSFDFREAVHDQWESLLHELYVRGALRGTASEAAYRVVTDLSVNDDQASEGGRFTVELHIAPSQPLRFLNVRLVQSGPEQLLVQEL
jgi:phage tail sheath protein FI